MRRTAHYTEKKKKLDALFEEIRKFHCDEEIASALCKHLCILASGYIENSVRDIIFDYTKRKSNENVTNFVLSRLKSLGNPKIENILQLVGAFNGQWRASIEQQLDEEMKDAINSIVSNRNQIAHGIDVGITFGQILSYYKSSVKVIEIIQKQYV